MPDETDPAEPAKPAKALDVIAIDLARVDSVALRRIIAEVQQDFTAGVPNVYDRIYNRHNR